MLNPGEHHYQTEIIERYRRGEVSVEESLIEMYLAGTSVCRVEDITQSLWGTRMNLGTLRNINHSLSLMIDQWRRRPITDDFPYVYLDKIQFIKSAGTAALPVSVLVAVGLNSDRHRKVLGVVESSGQAPPDWYGFLTHLKNRGLGEPQLVISKAWPEMVSALNVFYPQARWQHCVWHFNRWILDIVPIEKRRKVKKLIQPIHTAAKKSVARKKARKVRGQLIKMNLPIAAQMLDGNIPATLSFYDFPTMDWPEIQTSRSLVQILGELRRRTRMVESLPSGNTAMMLVAARLRHIAATRWEARRGFNMKLMHRPIWACTTA